MKKSTDEKALYDYLNSKGFKMKSKESSAYFGDYYSIWIYPTMQLRFVQERLIQSIEISSVQDKDAWYDLALVKALINNESNLNVVTQIPELTNFMKDHFLDIEALLTEKNYPKTKHRLEELGTIRARQIFPNLNI